MPDPAHDLPTPDGHAATDRAPLLRIQEVAAETGLTTRAIRYYEEIGLLEPAARSDGAYRLYDASDLERLRFIKSLRDDAGFSSPRSASCSRTSSPASATASASRRPRTPMSAAR